ncbi:MAG: stage IV sporulation protein A, partial [Clostridiales bacterium]|nr:stage IV sporulation protein A [Clostridiales bacterium]
VGYMVDGAMGHEENEKPRMVKSPWFDEEIPFDLAAETGTRKVIRDHSTIGIVVTTDGTISEIPRENYLPAEQRVVEELEALGKPFVILLNSTHPDAPETQALAAQLEQSYGRSVLPVSCIDLDRAALHEILRRVLYEFPVRELDFAIPRWVTMLDSGHWLQTEIYTAAMEFSEQIARMKDVPAQNSAGALASDSVERSALSGMNLSEGVVRVTVLLKPDVFYRVLSEQTGLAIEGESGLLPCLMELAEIKQKYAKIRDALDEVEATGYGIVMPSMEELRLEEPEIVKQGGKYGVRLQASAPSIHTMKADITTEVAPIVGSEKQSEELVLYLLKEFEENPQKLWESNIFGKSLHELVNEGLHNKLYRMPGDARLKLQETVERIINEGCAGLICIIL